MKKRITIAGSITGTLIAAAGVLTAVDTILQKMNNITDTMEARDTGPSQEEIWKWEIEAAIDSLEAYHE